MQHDLARTLLHRSQEVLNMRNLIRSIVLMSAVGACTGGEPAIEVTVRAAFAPVGHIVAYDTAGVFVAEADNPTLSLKGGVYYLDVRDTLGNPVFDIEGNLNFVVTAEGAELVLDPVHVGAHKLPLVELLVRERNSGDAGEHQAAIRTFADTASARGRVVWEAARAMVGPSLASGISWIEAQRYGQYNYIPEDPGAWSALRAAYAGDESCLPVPGAGVKCFISVGPADPSLYSCQGACPSPPPPPTTPPAAPSFAYRGGQCKAGVNLVLYRSGVYHQPGSWNFRKLPNDAAITSPTVTAAALAVGDVLRRTTGSGSPHAALVVWKLSPTRVVVYDSNFVGGDGNEYIGTHVMEILTSGSLNGTVYDLDTYRDLDCVYDSSPC